MYGGTKGRGTSWTVGLRRGPFRAAWGAGLTAVLAVTLVTASREPAHQILATAPLTPSGPGLPAPPTTPPVHLPDPSAHDVHGPASPARPGLPAAPAAARDIPPVALAAYQRSAAVMNAADPSCRLDWSLLAAIGQVESDHGRVGASRLDRHGVDHPAVVGPRLDGRHGTSVVKDTDAGRLDGDRRFDRAAGPMQFLPSTWAAVAVDGDDDGRRDVQDIDDASLGSAVYLCADHDDLATVTGQRRAVLRYNHSPAYVAQVLAIARDLSHQVLVPATPFAVRSVAFTDLRTIESRSARHDRVSAYVRSGHPRHEPTAGTSPHGPVIADPIPPDGPSDAPDPTPGPTPGPTPSPTPTPTPTPTPDPTPTPGPSEPGEPPVIPDPLPTELSGLSPAQVNAANAAWTVCDDDLSVGWSSDPDVVGQLTGCLAEQMGVAIDDPSLATFVAWLTHTQDPAPQP